MSASKAKRFSLAGLLACQNSQIMLFFIVSPNCVFSSIYKEMTEQSICMDIIEMLQNSENPCSWLVYEPSHIWNYACMCQNHVLLWNRNHNFFLCCWNLCQPDLGNDCLNRNDSVVRRSTSKTLSCRGLPVAPVGPSAGPFGPVFPVDPKTVTHFLK